MTYSVIYVPETATGPLRPISRTQPTGLSSRAKAGFYQLENRQEAALPRSCIFPVIYRRGGFATALAPVDAKSTVDDPPPPARPSAGVTNARSGWLNQLSSGA